MIGDVTLHPSLAMAFSALTGSASKKVAEDKMSVALPNPEPDPSRARHAS
jgi:hypothetical protein